MADRSAPLTLGLAAGLVISLVFVAGFASGAFLQQSRDSATQASSDRNLTEFLAAYRLVTHESYYRPFDRRHLIYAAIDGMLSATGDPHTLFLSPHQNQMAGTQLNGTQFSGIGAIVVPDQGRLQVVAPLPKAPAAQAGLRSGDFVVKIDGKRVSDLSGRDAVNKIHGPAGSIVRLTVVRGRTSPFTVRVRRSRIPPITAYGRLLPHHLAYIQLISFGDTTSRQLAEAISYIQKQGARGIILDLRGNPGGYVDAAQHVVSEFLSRGIVAYERGMDKQLRPLRVLSRKRLTRLPLVVLIDSGTASAAEIAAAALRDNHRATLLGARTYGKGSMQSVYALADGSSIRITDRLWLTPRKRSIQTVGIYPDIVANAAPGPAYGTRDSQLQRAQQYLVQHAFH